MAENTILPATPEEEPASQKQVDFLKGKEAYVEGMTKKEASEAIQKIKDEEMENTMPVGIHLVKFVGIDSAKKPSGDLITDRRGYPGLRITFMNKEKQKIDGIFFYDTDPMDKQIAKGDDEKCKSQFNLINLKKAAGLPAGAIKDQSLIDKARFYAIVQKVEFVNDDGELIKDNDKVRFEYKLAMRFYPAPKNQEGKFMAPPALEGDPANNDGKPSGIFYDTRKMFTSSSQKSNSSEEQTTIPDDPEETSIEAEDPADF